MERIRPLHQQYHSYTPQDHQVWQILFNRQMKLLNQHASSAYLHAIKEIGFQHAAIPHFSQVSERLMALTGWQLTVVPGLVPEAEFFQLLSRRIFPATCWLRTLAEIDYIEEPDMFHDVFGHVPLLTDPAYASFMQAFGSMALAWAHRPEAISLLSRIYWFTIEFGLIQEQGAAKIYGAGILSSPGETMHSMHPHTARRPCHAADIFATSYRTDVMQDQYFVISSFAHLQEMLPLVKTLIDNYEGPISHAPAAMRLAGM